MKMNGLLFQFSRSVGAMKERGEAHGISLMKADDRHKCLTALLASICLGAPGLAWADGCTCIQVVEPVCGYMNECEALCHGVTPGACPPPQTYTFTIDSATSSIRTSGGITGSGLGNLQVQGSFQATVYGEQFYFSNILVATTPASSFVFPSYAGGYQTLSKFFSGIQATYPNGSSNTYGGQLTTLTGNTQLTMQGGYREPAYDGYEYNFTISTTTAPDTAPAPTSAAPSDVMDAPHNSASGIFCRDCHSYSLWWQYSPMSRNDATYADRTRAICLTCHGTGGSSLPAQLHPGAVPGWGGDCMACHDAHFQAQLDWRGTVPDSDLYLALGTISSIQTDSASGISSLGYTLTSTAGAWSDPASWSAKNGSGKGLILVADTAKDLKTFQLTAADAASITVKGVVDSSMGGKSFGLIYGQQINSTIATPNGPREVKFFDPKGSSGYVNTESPVSGICQVCHTTTTYWTNDGANTTGHNNSCGNCHSMAQGFTP